jgi:transcriptional regulator with XRE-family HTH domain
MSTIYQRVGRALKVCRVRHGDLTIDQTAELLRPHVGRVLSRSTISQWERGVARISLEVVDAYCKTFGLSLIELLSDAGVGHG